MSTRIRVILLEDIADVGAAGDIVTVSEGFARNSLFPSGKAALATATHISRAERDKQMAKKAREEELQRFQERAAALDGTELTVTVRTKNDEDIFGTITAQSIAEELMKANVEVPARAIKLPKKITKLGSYEVILAFGSGVEATIHLNVVPLETPGSEKD